MVEFLHCFTGGVICRENFPVYLYQGVCSGVIPSGWQAVPVLYGWCDTAGGVSGFRVGLHTSQ